MTRNGTKNVTRHLIADIEEGTYRTIVQLEEENMIPTVKGLTKVLNALPDDLPVLMLRPDGSVLPISEIAVGNNSERKRLELLLQLPDDSMLPSIALTNELIN